MSEHNKNHDEAVTKIASIVSAARGARDGGHFLSPGDVADLRRMDIGQPAGAFWRLMVAIVPERDRANDEQERRWALVCRAIAVMAPRAHDGTVRPGAGLSSAGFSSEDRPIRINRLLRAEGDAFEDLFLAACAFLAAKAQPVDWRSFARLALNQDEAARKELARDFYQTKGRPAAAA